MDEYSDKYSKKLILGKEVKGAIPFMLRKPDNIVQVKKLDDLENRNKFIERELLKQREKTTDITIDATFDKRQDKVIDILKSLLKLWVKVISVSMMTLHDVMVNDDIAPVV